MLNRFSTTCLLYFILIGAFAQLPATLCPPSGGTRADIIDVKTAYRAPSGAAPTFTIPANATGAVLTISSHASVLPLAGVDVILGDEDFITITASLDLVANTSSGMLNFARNTNTDGSGTNLFSWLNTAFGTNVSTTLDKGQITSPALNGLTITRSGNLLTITETNNTLHSSYVIEFTSSATNSFIENGVARLVFSGGTPNLKTVPVPANTNFIVISRKGTVRISNYSTTAGTEEGYADERLLLDLDNDKLNGYSTVSNGASAAFRSTYVIQNHVTNSSTRFLSTGKVVGDFTGKSTTNTANTSDVGISNSAVYFTGTPAAGGTLTINELLEYTGAFDGVYIIEFYKRTGLGMSVAFIDTRTAFIQKGTGTFTGTSRDISIPAGADFIFLRQGGNANNVNTLPNENSLQAYAVINLNASPPSATGFFYQQVGYGPGPANLRRDDNFGFVNLPLNGTSARNLTYSAGYYSTHANNYVYDINFVLSPDKSTLTVTNAYGLVPLFYQTITEAQFFGRRPDLGFSTDGNDFVTANNGSCEDVEITVTVCNPGSGNSPGGFPVAFYDKNPTTDGTAKLIHLGNYANAVPQGNCNTYSFIVDVKGAGYNNPNIPIYCVVNDNGSFAPGGVGNTIGTPFTLASLATQNVNSNYIECDYTSNLKVITIVAVMACPTVNPLTTTNQSPTLTGTWDNINAQTNGLTVTVNGVTYALGTDPELTVVNEIWTLDLSAITLPIATYPVTIVTTNAKGTATDGTTNELVIKDIGVVYLDLNGLTDNLINGTGINVVEGDQLYINIINNLNNVAATVAVGANGEYLMPALPAGNYVFQLTTVMGVIGQAKPDSILPAGYVYTGEGTAPAGDGIRNGETAITIVNESTIIPNFGIQKRPLSGAPDLPGTVVGNVVQGPRFNPGTFGGFEIPSAAFGGTDDGQVSGLRLTALSSNILSITHNGVTYYRQAIDFPIGCPSLSCQEFPVGGLAIPAGTNGQPTNPITLATAASFLDGSLTLNYKTIDNAGFASSNTTALTIPMVALKFQNGNWSNGSGTANQPDLTDGQKTLFWVDNGGALTEAAVVKNLVIYNGIDATVDAVCLTVNERVDNRGGKLVMKATSDADYGQYLGPEVTATFEMPFETGWHNIGFPVNITATQWAEQNNTMANPFIVNISSNPALSNVRWYNSALSGGKEIGFYITRNSYTYSSHAYGQWNQAVEADILKTKAWSYFLDDYFSDGNPTVLNATGQTNATIQTFATHNNFGGWNMIPNIYPVSLSTNAMWLDNFFGDALVDSENLYDKVVFIWNPNDPHVNVTKGAYIAFDPENGIELNDALDPDNQGDALIAPFQAFYIRRANASDVRRLDVDGTNNNASNPAVAVNAPTDPALPINGMGTGASKTVTIKPEYRSACQITTNYKTQRVADLIILKAQNLSNGSYDMLELAFAGHYTNGIDPTFDIQKLGADESARPQIFTVVDGKALVINKMAIPTEGTKVPMGFSATANQQAYAISLKANTAWYSIYLEDKLTGAWHNLNDDEYSFANNTNFAIERFVLHFSALPNNSSYPAPVAVFSTPQGIIVDFKNPEGPVATVLVTNLIGQTLFRQEGLSTLEPLLVPINNSHPDFYVVSVIFSQTAYSEKVLH